MSLEVKLSADYSEKLEIYNDDNITLKIKNFAIKHSLSDIKHQKLLRSAMDAL